MRKAKKIWKRKEKKDGGGERRRKEGRKEGDGCGYTVFLGGCGEIKFVSLPKLLLHTFSGASAREYKIKNSSHG